MKYLCAGAVLCVCTLFLLPDGMDAHIRIGNRLCVHEYIVSREFSSGVSFHAGSTSEHTIPQSIVTASVTLENIDQLYGMAANHCGITPIEARTAWLDY